VHDSERRNIAVIAVYGDESADETKERVFAVAGVVGDEDSWASLQARWDERCGGVPFHANDCESNQGDFRVFSDQENKQRYKDLTSLLATYQGLGGFGIALDLIGRRDVFPEAPAGLAYYKCFLELVQAMRNCAAYNKEIAAFTFDMRPEGPHNSGFLYSIARKTSDWTPFLDTEIRFACAKENTRIQVADLFAREVMKALDNRIGPTKRPTRKSWTCLASTGRFHMDVFDKKWFLDLKANMPKLEIETGMSMRSYAQWLRETKRNIDNISNRFAYIGYVIQRDGE
jgi:hypothetical protein